MYTLQRSVALIQHKLMCVVWERLPTRAKHKLWEKYRCKVATKKLSFKH